MCGRHGDEVLHEELINAQVDTAQVLAQCQHTQQEHQCATHPNQTGPATHQCQQATATEQEPQGRVILHRSKGRDYLEQVDIMRMPPDQHEQPQDGGKPSSHKHDTPD